MQLSGQGRLPIQPRSSAVGLGLGRRKQCNSCVTKIMQGREVASPARLGGPTWPPVRHQNDCNSGRLIFVAIPDRRRRGRILHLGGPGLPGLFDWFQDCVISGAEVSSFASDRTFGRSGATGSAQVENRCKIGVTKILQNIFGGFRGFWPVRRPQRGTRFQG